MAVRLLSLVKLLLRLLCATFFTYVFIFSGLVVSLLSLLLLVVWPLSRSAYRYITSGLAYTVFGRERGDFFTLAINFFFGRDGMDLYRLC